MRSTVGVIDVVAAAQTWAQTWERAWPVDAAANWACFSTESVLKHAQFTPCRRRARFFDPGPASHFQAPTRSVARRPNPRIGAAGSLECRHGARVHLHDVQARPLLPARPHGAGEHLA